jgi:hypothetical protein
LPSGSRSVGIVRSRTQATEFGLVLVYIIISYFIFNLNFTAQWLCGNFSTIIFHINSVTYFQRTRAFISAKRFSLILLGWWNVPGCLQGHVSQEASREELLRLSAFLSWMQLFVIYWVLLRHLRTFLILYIVISGLSYILHTSMQISSSNITKIYDFCNDKIATDSLTFVVNSLVVKWKLYEYGRWSSV